MRTCFSQNKIRLIQGIRLRVLIVVLLNSSALLAQERTNRALPIIGTQIKSQLIQARGWTRSPEGQWISRQNRIPAYLDNSLKALIDYGREGLGIDNFISYQFRDIKIQDSTYTILIKKYSRGYYKYPSIREGWMSTTEFIYYVFDKSELNKIHNVIDGQINLVSIKLIFFGYESHKETYIDDIQKDIVKHLDKKESDQDIYDVLILHIAPYRTKNLVQFQIYLTKQYYYLERHFYGDVFGIIKEPEIQNDSSDYQKIYLNDSLFDHCYYETDYVTFNNFILLPKK